MIPRKLSIEVLLDPRSLPLPTIGLHHMEGRFLHLLTLLNIKFLLDHHLETQKVPYPTWAPDLSQFDAHDPSIDEFGNFKGKIHHALTHPPGKSNIAQHKHCIKTQPIDLKSSAPIFPWSTNIPLR